MIIIKTLNKLQGIDKTKILNTTPSNKPCHVIIILLRVWGRATELV